MFCSQILRKSILYKMLIFKFLDNMTDYVSTKRNKEETVHLMHLLNL